MTIKQTQIDKRSRLNEKITLNKKHAAWSNTPEKQFNQNSQQFSTDEAYSTEL